MDRASSRSSSSRCRIFGRNASYARASGGTVDISSRWYTATSRGGRLPRAGMACKEGRVLVVDDEPMVRETLGQVLADEGYVVDLADRRRVRARPRPRRAARRDPARSDDARHERPPVPAGAARRARPTPSVPVADHDRGPRPRGQPRDARRERGRREAVQRRRAAQQGRARGLPLARRDKTHLAAAAVRRHAADALARGRSRRGADRRARSRAAAAARPPALASAATPWSR